MGNASSLMFKLLYKCSSGAFKSKLNLLKHGWSLMVSPDSFLVKCGYVNSFISRETLDFDYESVPWMNYGIIELLKDKITFGLKIFEYGSGNSTIFFAKRVEKLVSIEYDRKWFQLITTRLNEEELRNVDYVFCKLESNYCNRILEETDLFDLVVIDGRQRVACAKAANSKLSKMGIVLLDDSDRTEYLEIFDFYHNNGFSHLTFSGLKPLGFGIDYSTIFYRRGQNCFNL